MTPSHRHNVLQQFERQVEREPNALAVASAHGQLTYRELDDLANDLAVQLRARGIGPEIVVGLCVPRSPATLVGALAIFKAGGAYLPVDPTEPEARLNFMFGDAGVSVVVTENSLKEKMSGANRQVIAVDEMGRLSECRASARPDAAPVAVMDPKTLAYVIYTSGSTGTPKGVEIAQESLSNLVAWHQSAFNVIPFDRASCVARVGFDAAVWEIWPYLTAGASLHIPDEEKLKDPEAFQSWLVAQGITISFVPTPMAERLLALRWPANNSLRMMLTGGDTLHVFPPSDLPFLLVNNYGPTECAVVATSGLVPPQRTENRLPSIGRPIANTRVYLLDDAMREVPPGTPGEIYIGGLGVARGYRNRPELTAERFLPNPFDGDSSLRFFKTGDCAQALPDGQLAFLGRFDEQIKIRGFRIEPNEIVAALNEHPAVSQSVVVARELAEGDNRLVAYFVPRAGRIATVSELRDFLGARLPAYMVPAMYVTLDTVPLTPNGKVDRASLPAPDASNLLGEDVFHAPRTEVEQAVAGILAPLLGVEKVDVEANFFSLGGHSLLGIQLISRVRDSLGVELSLRTVFEAPSVAELSAEIERLLCAKLESMSEEEVQRTLGLAEKAQP
ncbi:MAG TPA: non-ribosomal peptide synthetase [Verrucomicrobiae bacterium]|jgi:amino acid adenylation domain-containing protein|nr:non-ribosomal peptide synthetase [Verrucomicrobiae bacterium]